MWIGVVSLFPEMFDAITQYGVSGRSIRNKLLDLEIWNPRDFAHDRHRTVDDRPYGGGPGMVMAHLPLKAAISAAREAALQSLPDDEQALPVVIYLSPQGRKLDQAGVEELASKKQIIFIAGRYEGVDERLIKSEVDEEWSLGDYVLSGGELAAMVVIDSICRQIPGVLGHEDSASQDSFAQGLLDYPHYTRPELVDDMPVPSVLLSGNHEKIKRWRLKQALGRTWQRRPDLFKSRVLTVLEQQLLDEFKSDFDAG